MARPGSPKSAQEPVTPAAGLHRKAVNQAGKANRLLSASNLAIWLDVNRGTVTRWIADGMPVEKEPETKGGSYEVDPAAVVRWLQKKASDDAKASKSTPEPSESGAESSLPPGWESKEEADRRRAVALANIAEAQEEEAYKRVVPIEAVAALMTAERIACRTKLENLGASLAGRTAKMTNPAEIKIVADELVSEAADCIAGDITPLLTASYGPDAMDEEPDVGAEAR